MSLIPPPDDRKPFLQYIGILLSINMLALFLPLLPRALYCAWVICGVAFLVQEKVEPGLPRTLSGNPRRVMRAHVWPLYMVKH